MFNFPMTTPSTPFMRASPYSSIPPMNIPPTSAPFANGAFPSQNSMYASNFSAPDNLGISDPLGFPTSTYYAGAASAPVIGHSGSYGSLNAANQMQNMNGNNFALNLQAQLPNASNSTSTSTIQMPNINGVDMNATQMFSSNPVNFGKSDSPTVNDSLRTSYSSPTFSNPGNSQESGPMDLSNPYSSQFTNTPGSSFGGTPQSSFDDEAGIDLSLPPFNW